MAAQRILVIGGNGFTGSAICRSAIARGWEVISLSRSGAPYATADGYQPSWVQKVEWRAGSPFDAPSYVSLLPECTAVVSTLGILFETEYKSKGQVNPIGIIRGIAESLLGDRGNPLQRNSGGTTGSQLTYERMNRDAGLASFRAFSESSPVRERCGTYPFVYLSAEDIFRPFISSRYIETKREAERIIDSEVLANNANLSGRQIRPIFIRPSLIYHPIINSMTTIPATALSASSHIQSILPDQLRLSKLFPSSQASSSSTPPATSSLAALLTIPPIHVDTIAEAVCQSIEDDSIRGIVDVRRMRLMSNYDDVFDSQVSSSS